ncbi:MAG: glycoside hydrolase family 127 protein [Alistipes sp.]|nr:glycoside hydrolase family 127 protein [Alistipes sp.]
MKLHNILCCIFAVTLSYTANAQVTVSAAIEDITIGGHVGSRIDDCITHRVKAQDWEHLVEPFRHRNETHAWQSEFWGKWVQGAIASYRYNRDPELYEIIRQSAEAMMATQTPDGYIGNYHPDHHLQQWDVWGRKYTMLGLVAWYDLSGDRRALKSACRVLDHLMSEVGEGKTDIISTGNYHGMASCSVLEPVVYIYHRTKNSTYLDFAKYIAHSLTRSDGPELVRKAIEGVNVANRFPHPKEWWSRENGQKAYEMMSCYVGLLEMYKLSGEEQYLRAVERVVKNIISTEINIAGSGAAFECWYGGRERQTLPAYHTMETCVTFTWMQLCERLLEVNHNMLLADQIELTMYNALMASLHGDAHQISKYSPLEGWRTAGEEQCGMHINCCNANGPRAFALIPRAMYHTSDHTIAVNLYADSEATLHLTGKHRQPITIRQRTTYPQDSTIELDLSPRKPMHFSLTLRIPAWADLKHCSVEVNGTAEQVRMHGCHIISRTWQAGDKVVLKLDMRGRLIKHDNHQAIMRGPVVLARDSRFGDGFVDECANVVAQNGYVVLTPAPKRDFAWMTFTAPAVLGTDLESNGKPVPIHLCDFGSAGNTWEKSVRYRVWLPQTLNVMHSPYVPYNVE